MAGVYLTDCLWFQGQRVVDLGCGLGLVGLVAATLLDETARVDLTDGDADLVRRAAASAERNAAVSGARDVAASVLWWDEAPAIAALNATAAGSGVSGGGSYDLVLASDCIYENGGLEVAAGMAKALAKTARDLLRPEPPESLPLRGETQASEWHGWTDCTDSSRWTESAAASDEYVWPPVAAPEQEEEEDTECSSVQQPKPCARCAWSGSVGGISRWTCCWTRSRRRVSSTMCPPPVRFFMITSVIFNRQVHILPLLGRFY